MKNMMMDFAFTIETEKEFEDLTQSEIMAAILKRLESLQCHWETGAIGFCDEYEIKNEDDQSGNNNIRVNCVKCGAELILSSIEGNEITVEPCDLCSPNEV